MRLKQISVDGLFGIFNHDVHLNLQEHITIISGPNGFGKTILLKMTHAVLSGNVLVLRGIPFLRFTLAFDDGSAVEVVQREASSEAPSAGKLQLAKSRKIEFTRVKDRQRIPVAIPRIGPLSPAILRLIDAYVPSLTLHEESWRHKATGEVYSADDIIELYSHRIPSHILESIAQIPLFPDIHEALHVRFISTQRLSAVPTEIRRRTGDTWLYALEEGLVHGRGGPTSASSLAVDMYSNEIAANIRSLLEAYAARSQELDRTFPQRLLKQAGEVKISPEDLLERFKNLEAKRSTLVELGFLDKEETTFTPPREWQVKEQLAVFSVYVADTEKKLAVFDDMATKIGFFVRTINDRFKYKSMKVSRDKGFMFTSKIGALAPRDLSSGEQHELVMLYELLFKADKTWLVLMDEPEISLHVDWQEKFLDDLQQIQKLSAVDIIVATHSPVIIGDHWGLTQALSGPAEV